ncbi:hypothetical protein CBR_g35033 [Chara braunii]|uniref:Rubisco LSMT substrate-binding domain-containing protein n=1 Tax=Chara braunii TaxID=69332 RepID=A0A388LK20_CHABU|nr:hypothetical protein CBR_g35033 [Chara braunii]|eukprot:GBG82668.1 hypothetical protein CBR_g35033 [Chara braunii]
MASLLNHSVCPHITNFSKLDPVSKTLRLRALRSCDRGKECYLSYGALPNSHLLMFYGFIPREPNPYDTIQIDLELPEDDDFADARRQLFEKYELTFSHALRASPRIPSKLLAALRVMSMDEEDFANFSQDGSNVMEPLSSHNEKAAIDCLLSMIGVFLNPLEYEAGEAIEEIPTGYIEDEVGAMAPQAIGIVVEVMVLTEKASLKTTKWSVSVIDSEMVGESRVMVLIEKASLKTTVSWDTQ